VFLTVFWGSFVDEFILESITSGVRLRNPRDFPSTGPRKRFGRCWNRGVRSFDHNVPQGHDLGGVEFRLDL
jgi:hypothetical protein